MWKFNTGKSRGRGRGTSYKNTHGSLGRSQVSALSCHMHLGEGAVFCGFNLLSPAHRRGSYFPSSHPPLLSCPRETKGNLGPGVLRPGQPPCSARGRWAKWQQVTAASPVALVPRAHHRGPWAPCCCAQVNTLHDRPAQWLRKVWKWAIIATQ